MRIVGVLSLVALLACGDSPVQAVECEPESLTIWKTQEANPDVCPSGDPGALESAQVEDDRVATVTMDGDRLVITGTGQGSTEVTVQTSNAGTVGFTAIVNEALETEVNVCEVQYDDSGEQDGLTLTFTARALVDLAAIRYSVKIGNHQPSPAVPLRDGDMQAGETVVANWDIYHGDGEYGDCEVSTMYVVVD